MREILFRGKDKNGRWHYGSYLSVTAHWHNRGKHKDWIITGALQNGGWLSLLGRYAVLPETVGQYSGLKDKNGNMIFEGDIIHWDWEKIPYIVCWSVNTCQFTTDMRWLWSSIENVEILGNIHDHPEVLDG